MKRLKRSLSVILALVTVMACSISSFAAGPVNPFVAPGSIGYSAPYIVIEAGGKDYLLCEGQGKPSVTVNIKAGQNVDLIQECGDYTFDLYMNGESVVKNDMLGLGWNFKVDGVFAIVQSGYVLNAVFTPTAQAVPTTAPAPASDLNNASAQNTPAGNASVAGIPDLSNPEIKALWDQAVAIKAAYDAETNKKAKKKLQKQFTDIMNQIPLK